MTGPQRLVPLVIALLLTACGVPAGDGGQAEGPPGDEDDRTEEGGVDTGEPGAPDGPPREPGAPGEPPGEPPEPAEPELREAVEAADIHPVTIERFEVVDERTIRAVWWGGVEPCHVLSGVEVAETDDEVRVRVLAGRDAAADDDVACIMIALELATDFTLERDLGDRELVDAGDEGEDRRPEVRR